MIDVVKTVDESANLTGGTGEDLVNESALEKPQGLSNRDALEVAIAASKEDKKDLGKSQMDGSEKRRTISPDKPSQQGARTRLSEGDNAQGKTSDVSGGEGVSKGALQPPAEYSPEEKADFLASTPKQQEAALRLNKAGLSRIEAIKREKEDLKREATELQWAKDIVKEITPFLKTRGDKGPTHTQVINALKVVNEVDSNTQAAVVSILKAKGIPVPRELEDSAQESAPDPQIATLQEELKTIKDRQAQEDLKNAHARMQKALSDFESDKNAAGATKYPDFNNTESGINLARNIGSLVRGEHPHSQGFFAYVEARVSDKSDLSIMREAYKWFGGKVDDSETPRTQATQKQIMRSSRASSSVPGRGASSSSSGPAKKLSRRDALAAALEEHRESEGH